MESNNYDFKWLKNNQLLLDKLTKLRHLIHQEAEGGMNQPKTIKKIKKFINAHIQIENNPNISMTQFETCGLIIDIWGTNKDISPQIPEMKGIAFRAELDALKIKERTDLVPYYSTSDYSHMCGHDGHTVSVLGLLIIVSQNADKFNYVIDNIILIE